MKIVHIAKYYHPIKGGIEKQVRLLTEGLPKKFDINVIAADKKYKKEKINDINVTKLKELIKISSAPIYPSLYKQLKNIRTDIIHLHLPNPFAVICYLFAKPKGKLIIHWHSDIIGRKLFYQFYKPFSKKIIQKADIIVGATKNHFKNFLFKNYKDKCKVIPYGIEIPKHINKIKKKNNKNILFIGRLVEYKGLKYLIKAMKNIDSKLTIIGDGPLKKKLKQQVIREKVRVEFLHNVGDEEKEKYLETCSMLVLPSITKNEAFGIVQLEAMVHGKPVISTSLGTGVELVNLNNVTGLVVSPKKVKELSNAINYLLKNEKNIYTYGNNARKRVKENFTDKKMIEEFSLLYTQLYTKM